MDSRYLFLIVAAGFVWAVFKFVQFRKDRKQTKVIKTTGPPFIVPPEAVKQPPALPPQPVNREQRRRLDKQQKKYNKKFAGKTNRDEIRSGKIIEANDFLKQYFDNGKK